MADDDVKEGFLCPVCIKDLGSVVELQMHFDAAHSHEDSDIKQAFREFVGRARQRIRKELSDDVPETVPFIPYVYRPAHWVSGEQQPGVVMSHLRQFRGVRDERADHRAAETNKLVLRLERLVSGMPSDQLKRRAFERSVVAWVDGQDIDLCPDCGRRFSLTRRKHHCRVCGFVMCDTCSRSLLVSRARALLSSGSESAVVPTGDCPRAVSGLSRALDALLPGRRPASLRRAGSHSSLDSVLLEALSPAEPQLRVCSHCSDSLERRQHRLERLINQPPVVQLYERLTDLRQQVTRLSCQHSDMLQSLMSGDTAHRLQDLQQVRRLLLGAVEAMELLARRVASLGAEEPSPRVRKLQQRVCTAASDFLKLEILTNLPQLPTEQQLIEIRQQMRTAARLT